MNNKTEKVCLWILKDKRALQATQFQLIPRSKPIKAPWPILSKSAENSQKVAKEWQKSGKYNHIMRLMRKVY